jgi:uncharacterized protein (TIGR02246 family)
MLERVTVLRALGLHNPRCAASTYERRYAMTEAATEAGDRILKRLEEAWNKADGEAFGAPFADDAELVTIRGEHHSGRIPIARGHQAIFDSIYKDSVVRFEAVATKPLSDDVVYVLAHSTLNVPSGPLAGEHEARFSIVLSRGGNDDWQIAAFHNTLVAPPPQA